MTYVWDTREAFHEYYDGERSSIPEEYRVMTFQDDLPEEEKTEWAMDIAFDMDEFFRQRDPQYAAEHPEVQAAKEEIYENLMAGRISALDEKLAALGQTQEDYLPSAHFFVYEPFFILRDIEFHLSIPLSVCHVPPPFFIRVWNYPNKQF